MLHFLPSIISLVPASFIFNVFKKYIDLREEREKEKERDRERETEREICWPLIYTFTG